MFFNRINVDIINETITCPIFFFSFYFARKIVALNLTILNVQKKKKKSSLQMDNVLETNWQRFSLINKIVKLISAYLLIGHESHLFI